MKLTIFKSLLILFFAVCVALVSSCNKEKEFHQNYEAELRSTGIDSLENELHDFWTYGIDQFGLEILCGCDCEATLEIIDFWNTGKIYAPEITHYLTWNGEPSCEDLRNVFKQRCEFSTVESFGNFVLDNITEEYYLTDDELILLSDLKDHIVLEGTEIDSFKNRWSELQTLSPVDNKLSLIIIETTSSLINHYNLYPEIWEGLPDTPDDVQPWVWKAIGAFRGAVSSAVGVLLVDVAVNGENGEDSDVTVTHVVASAVFGGIVGGVTSL
jgi:hypothetical protein